MRVEKQGDGTYVKRLDTFEANLLEYVRNLKAAYDLEIQGLNNAVMQLTNEVQALQSALKIPSTPIS